MKILEFTNFEKLEYTRAEQFNSISVNLDFCGDDIKKIIITCSHENEGKSFIAMQLWRNCAANGKKVILLDCDLRRSRIVKDYGAQTDGEIIGLSHYLAGIATLDDVLYKADIDNADIILAGKTVSNPINLLKKDKFDALLDKLSRMYDLVIVDTPPVQPVIDGAYIAKKCDGTVLVINYGETSVYEVTDTKNQLLSAHANILGTVLNNVPHNAGKYYYSSTAYGKKYGYKYYRYYGKYKSYNYYSYTSGNEEEK